MTIDEATAAPEEIKGRSLTQIAWGRLRRDKTFIASSIILLVVLLVALFAPFITGLLGVDPYSLDKTAISTAGDQGDDASYTALRVLRTAVVQDLQARGAVLSPLVTVTAGDTRPALAAAQQLYRDASRADQLVVQADPIHPLFLPTTYTALAA